MNTVLMRDACQGLRGHWQFHIRLVCGQRVPRVLPSPGKRPQEREGQLPPPTPPLPARRTQLWQGLSAAGCSVAVVGTQGELWGGGSSHLLDVEQQQQLQRLHGRQERCEENTQPGREGKRSSPRVWAPRGAERGVGQGTGTGCRQTFIR